MWSYLTVRNPIDIYALLLLLLLLLRSRFIRVRVCVTPWTAAHQAPQSLGFSRQEHWSGLPCPPPIHESEMWKWSRSVGPDSYRPHGLQPTRLLCPWDFPSKSTGVGCHYLLQVGSQPPIFKKHKHNIKILLKVNSIPKSNMHIHLHHFSKCSFLQAGNLCDCNDAF